jgi:hypothetical protein
MTNHEKAVNILNEIWGILQQIPGTLPQHQERLVAVQFIRQRIDLLNTLQPEPVVDAVPVATVVAEEDTTTSTTTTHTETQPATSATTSSSTTSTSTESDDSSSN